MGHTGAGGTPPMGWPCPPPGGLISVHVGYSRGTELTVEQGGFSVICSWVNWETKEERVHTFYTPG